MKTEKKTIDHVNQKGGDNRRKICGFDYGETMRNRKVL